MRQNIWCGHFAFDPTQMVEVVRCKAQYRETHHVEVQSCDLASMQHRQKPLKACLHFKKALRSAMSVMHSKLLIMCLELVVWSLHKVMYNHWQKNFRAVFASWDKIDMHIKFTSINIDPAVI